MAEQPKFLECFGALANGAVWTEPAKRFHTHCITLIECWRSKDIVMRTMPGYSYIPTTKWLARRSWV